MKLIIKSIVFLMFYAMSAQNYNFNDVNINELNQGFLFVEQMNNTNNRGVSLTNNEVFLRQIGERNLSEVLIISDNSNINILQKGDDNKIDLKINADEIEENIIQIGNNLNYTDISILRSNNPKEVEVFQKGENQNILMRGSNSLSEKMKIKQKGNNTNVIINNFY